MMIEVDDEELGAVIQFQKDMLAGALESLEMEEAEQRRVRIAELEALRRK